MPCFFRSSLPLILAPGALLLAACAGTIVVDGPPRLTHQIPPPAHAVRGAGAAPDLSAADAYEQGLIVVDPAHPLGEGALIRGTRWPLAWNTGSSYAYEPEAGIVSFYDDHQLATGERYDPGAHAAAHKMLPFGTIVRCTRTDTGASVVVMINDRGPYIDGRILDLSRGAAAAIGLVADGIAPCRIDVIAYPLVETMGPRGNG